MARVHGQSKLRAAVMVSTLHATSKKKK